MSAQKIGQLQIQENFIGEDLATGKSWGQEPSPYYEPYTDNLGQLFKSLRREYGRCTSRVYQDAPDGTADPIGWVFEKKVEYEDADRARLTGRERFYNRQVWVTYRWN